jgi:hypothetical protein
MAWRQPLIEMKTMYNFNVNFIKLQRKVQSCDTQVEIWFSVHRFIIFSASSKNFAWKFHPKMFREKAFLKQLFVIRTKKPRVNMLMKSRTCDIDEINTRFCSTSWSLSTAQVRLRRHNYTWANFLRSISSCTLATKAKWPHLKLKTQTKQMESS